MLLTAVSSFPICLRLIFCDLSNALGNCWFIAAAATLATKPQLLEKVVPMQQSFTENYAGAARSSGIDIITHNEHTHKSTYSHVCVCIYGVYVYTVSGKREPLSHLIMK